MNADEKRLLAMCDAEFGWKIDDFIAVTRAVVPSLLAERDRLRMSDSYVMANANRCTVHSQHIMVNQGRSEPHFADLYRCDCGEERLGRTDETLCRATPGANG